MKHRPLNFTAITLSFLSACLVSGHAFAGSHHGTTHNALKNMSVENSAANNSAIAQTSSGDRLTQLENQINALTEALEASNSNVPSHATFGGYGEHHFTLKEGADNTIDAHRYVLMMGYNYDDKVSFHSEFELEHSLAGEGKPGEVELEQAYINYKANPTTDVKLGMFLMPVGLINSTHEPDTFYGVERPVFAKRILPSTWWETGVMISGQATDKLRYDLAIHSPLQTTTSIRSGRKKQAKATANEPAYTARLSFTPSSNLKLASTVNYQPHLSQARTGPTNSALLAEVNAVYQLNHLTVKGVYGYWDREDLANESGFYVEPSYKTSDKVGVFARYSALSYNADIKNSNATTRVDLTQYGAGVSYFLHKNVVVKADVQKAESTKVLTYNIGLGWSY